MKILQRYLLQQLLRNFVLGLLASTSLFMVFDFFDRIDNVLVEGATVLTVIQYFAFKTPAMSNQMLPVAAIFATIFTYGLLSKNSEITAMRASGAKLTWLARPLVYFGAALSISSFIVSETIIPYTESRQKELYNIDIQQKDKLGNYSQANFWWRNRDAFYSVENFDSRTNTLYNFSQFELTNPWDATRRTDATQVRWIDPVLGWSMNGVVMYQFGGPRVTERRIEQLPLPLEQQPRDFYEFRSDPNTMSHAELKRFIARQGENGISTFQYLPDLHRKFAFPLICLIVPLLALPFALLSSRTGSMAMGSVIALLVGFSYYAVDSFSISLGRAELLPAPLSAWLANFVMGSVAFVLNLGAESPR